MREGLDDDPWAYPLKFGDTLSNHDWVPLKINRLLTSKFLAYSVAEDRLASAFLGFLLWVEAFKQDPAGTLPNDDVQLSQLARCRTVDEWRVHRDWALYGWSPIIVDGDFELSVDRLGHPTIAEIAVDMHKRSERRDKARHAQRDSMLRGRVRARLKALGWRKEHWGNPQIVDLVASWLRENEMYCTDENVRAAMSDAVGIPNVVAFMPGTGPPD